MAAFVGACGSDVAEPSDAVDAADSLVRGAQDVAEEGDAATGELAETLRSNGAVTIASVIDDIDVSQVIGEDFSFFAPDDEAFTSLSADEIADLLVDPDMVAELLRNHLVDEPISSSDLATLGSIDAESGAELRVLAGTDGVRVGDALVVTADLEAGSGVVHVVDALLLP